MTDITPNEAAAFVRWSGEKHDEPYSLPRSSEWYQVYEQLKSLPPIELDQVRALGLRPRTEILIEKLFAATTDNMSDPRHSMVNTTLMSGGVFEWVHLDKKNWGGAGKPHSSIGAGLINLDAHKPSQPRKVDPAPAFFGFRMIKR
ncbi:MAG: hypothetical protein AAFP90_07135 [Planctomycetota bacterium]